MRRWEVTASEKNQASITGLAVLHVELAHRAGDDEIIVVEHELAGDAVFVELESHRIDRSLLALFLLRFAVEIADGHRPALERFHMLVRRRRIRRSGTVGRD